MNTTSLIVIVVILALLAFLFHQATSKKCPRCGGPMKLLTQNVGHKKKYECKKCKKRIDTGIPTGRGKR